MKPTKLFLLTAVLLLILSLTSFANASQTDERLSYRLGDQINDFTFTTYDGQSYSLYEVMKGKEAVLLNIWATWCGPCRTEFPYMQQAYEKYQDKVEVIALSCEKTDTADVLAAFAQSNGLTFKIGQDSVGFLQALGIGSIPTTLMIDRFGTICFIESGAQTSVEAFERLFEAFLGDEYTESVLLRGIPGAKPNVASSSEEQLSAAIDSPASNPTSAYTWPMLVTEKDGRSVVASSNAKQASTEAAVTAKLNAKAGTAIVVTFKTSTESIFDLMQIRVNGEIVKVFSGEHDWMDYAIPVSADGEYTVKVSYLKDNQSDSGEDMVWIDRIAIVENAEQAMQANPVYPIAEESSLHPSNPEAREIVFEDPNGLLYANFGNAKYYITNTDATTILGTLSAAYDPEAAFIYTSEGALHPLTSCMSDEGYSIEMKIDSAQTTGYVFSSVYLYTDNTGMDYQTLLLFRDEENVNMLAEYNALGEWSYVDDSIEENKAIIGLPAQVDYVLKCIDQDGAPVAGVMMQVCDETTCQVFVSDEEGLCKFTAAPYAWEVHVLMAPGGYAADTTQVLLAPAEGGELVFQLTRN